MIMQLTHALKNLSQASMSPAAPSIKSYKAEVFKSLLAVL